ncbi:hypothetical protein EGW08_006856 [Elysia chlorotica]|uniref:Ig-like domain-containing protein n=1 Tax=Elysia chlorotica TaxID=188477 RepID=A0A3S0ZRW5_ELYCH|nr:hypothetical protein EGW08_006856 [Elysia chlorotica]
MGGVHHLLLWIFSVAFIIETGNIVLCQHFRESSGGGAISNPTTNTPFLDSLGTGEIILIPPTEDVFENVGPLCWNYLSRPFVPNNAETLKALVDTLQGMDVFIGTGFWVSISGREKWSFTAHIGLDLFAKMVLPAVRTRWVCVGLGLVDCPYQGTCMGVKNAGPDTVVEACRYKPPTSRMVQSQGFQLNFNITCQVSDSCLQLASTKSAWLLPQYYFTYYKDGNLLLDYRHPDSSPLKMSELDIDSEFQCMYTLNNIVSNATFISRPEIKSERTSVWVGRSVTLSCRDPGTVHILGESVTFEWNTPTVNSVPTADNTLQKVNFQLDDIGSYRCRSVVGGVRSVWSKPLSLTVRWLEPVLMATNLLVPFGSAVTLTCSVKFPEGYNPVFTFKKSGSDILGLDSSLRRLDILDFGPEDAGDYQCLAQSTSLAVGISNTVTLQMEDTSLPVLVSNEGELLREEREVKLTCQMATLLSGNIEYSFIFRSFSDNLALSQSYTLQLGRQSELTISKFSSDNEGIYECKYTVADSNGNRILTSGTSNTVTLRMPKAVLQSSATTVPDGSNVKLVCNVNNYSGTTDRFYWLKGEDHQVLLTTAENAVTVRNFQPGNGGTYRCQAVLSDPRLRDPPLVSPPLDLVYAPRFQKCPCVCTNLTLSIPAASAEVIAESALAIQKNLSVSRAGLSSSVRRVSSAPDGRRSSESAGYIAVALLSLVTGLVLVPDVVSVVFFLVQTFSPNTGAKEQVSEKLEMQRSHVL